MSCKGIKAFTIICLTVLLTGCGSDVKKEKHDGKVIFKYNEPTGVATLDPAFATSLESIRVIDQIFNGLVQMDEHLNVVPCIAKRWEISEDGKEYTFYLRDDVYFHDHEVFEGGKGRKVVASDVVSSFFRIVDSRNASRGRQWIINYLDQTERGDYIGFKALNDTTFKVFLKEPFMPFLGILSMKFFSVVPSEVVDFYGPEFRRNPVGTGPFKFRGWIEEGKLILARNDNYFERDKNGEKIPYIDGISIQFIKDEEIAFMDFMKGNLDMLNGITGEHTSSLLDHNGNLKDEYKDEVKLISKPFLNTEYLGFFIDADRIKDPENPVLKKEIRQAINYGFDRKLMVKYMRNSLGTPANSGFVPKGLPSYNEEVVVGYHYDPGKARELLEKAGYPGGEGLPEITLSTTGQYQDLCEFIQSQLSEIGIKLKIDINPPAVHREWVALGKADFFRKSWVADYPDAENYLSLFYSKNFSPGGANYTHFSNLKFDVLYEQAQREPNDSIRYEMYQAMDQIVIEEAPVVPLYYDQIVRFTRPEIENLVVSPTNLHYLKYVKKRAGNKQ